MNNFKDANSIAQRQDDLYKQWVSYEESKQYAIDNKFTFDDWKTVKMYTWWKQEGTANKPEWYHFKDWNDFRTKVDSISKQLETDADWDEFQRVLDSSDVWWVSYNDLWLVDPYKVKAKEIDKLVKDKTSDAWFNQLMWYYNEDDKDVNDDLVRDIAYNPNITSKQRSEWLRKIQEDAKTSIQDRSDNAWDSIEELKKVQQKNSENESLRQNARSQSLSINAYYNNVWLNSDKSDGYINAIKKVYIDPKLTDEQKDRKIDYIIHTVYWVTTREIANAYKRKYSKVDPSTLSKDQLAEKQMYETYIKNYNDFKNKAQQYLSTTK